MSERTLAEPADLRGFPSVRPPARLVRVCRATRSTWWYSSDGSGRFDLAPPDGSCYLATDAYAAIREASRLGPVSATWLRERELRRVPPPDTSARLAATTHAGAGRFGATTELATLVPYELTRRWAAAFRRAGFDGVRHELRHDPRARPSGVALFGSAGAGAHADGERSALTFDDVERAGVAVLDVPSASSLTIVD